MTLPVSTIRSLRLQEFEPDQLLDAVRGARFEHYVLGGSTRIVQLDHWSCGDVSVDVGRYSFPLRAVGPFPANRLCLGYMRSLGRSRVNGFAASRQTIELYPCGAELDYYADTASEWVAIEFSEEALQDAAHRHLGQELDIPWGQTVSFDTITAERALLDRLVNRLWPRPADGTAMIRAILGSIAGLLADVRDRTRRTPPGWKKRQARIRRAEAYLRANLDQPVDLASLAAAVGAAPRTLQKEFVAAYGISPLHWRRCLALHHARHLLRAPDGRTFTIEAIARRCGFRHMGRFAGYFRDLFGEHPSHALHSRKS